MKSVLLALTISLFGLPLLAQEMSSEDSVPVINWSDGNSCTQANEKEVTNLVSEKSEKAKETLRTLTSAVQAWADGKEDIQGLIVQSGVNFTAVPTLHALEGAADGVQILSENGHRFLGYSFDMVTCFADDLVEDDNSRGLSAEMKDGLKGSKSAVNCVIEFGGTVTSLFFLSGAELVQSAAGTVNNMVSDVFTGIALNMEFAGDYFLDKGTEFGDLVGEGIYMVASVINNVEVIITGTLTAVVVAVNTGAQVATQLVCGTARSLKKFVKYLKKGRPFKALAALAKGICKAVVNGVMVAIDGFKRIIAIFQEMFEQAGLLPVGLGEDEVELIMSPKK